MSALWQPDAVEVLRTLNNISALKTLKNIRV